MHAADFDAVVKQGAELQRRFPGKHLVAVGGTAAALHCGHRFSLDVDCVTPHLQAEFNEFAERLESWPGWRTNRTNPPVMILGERGGVELGVRQMRRAVPLQTSEVNGLIVPTCQEILRVKAFLLGERRATRDYLDFAALTRTISLEQALAALSYLNLLYPAVSGQTTVTRLAEACEATPADFTAVDLPHYRGLVAPFNDWKYVSGLCRQAGRQLLKLELEDRLPSALPTQFA